MNLARLIGRSRTSREARLGWAGAGLIAVGSGIVLAFEARGLTFSADDWQFILDRRPLSAHVLLSPHLQHLSAVPILAYRVLRSVFGTSSYAPFLALSITTHVAACLLLYAVARRYVGPWAALAPMAILALLGPAWQDLLWAFQFGYIASVATGLAAFLALGGRSRVRQIVAAAMLGVSVACSSVGLGMVIVVLVLLALERPWDWRRLWIPLAPLALYGLWYLAYGVSDAHSANLHRVPGDVADALAAAAASLSGLGRGQSSTLTVHLTLGWVVAAVLLVTLVVRRRRGGRIAPLAWAAAAGALALWIAAALAYFPSREPNQSRFQYYSVALVLLVIVAGFADWRPTRRTGALLAALTAAIVASNAGILDTGARGARLSAAFTGAEGGAMLVAQDRMSPTFAPDITLVAAEIPFDGLLSVRGGPFLATVRQYGSPADTARAIARRTEWIREAADLILGSAERLRLQRVSRIPSRGVICTRAATGGGIERHLLAGTIYARASPRASAVLQVRRFADRYRYLSFGAPVTIPHTHVVVIPPVALSTGAPVALRLPLDRSSRPWWVRMAESSTGILCATA